MGRDTVTVKTAATLEKLVNAYIYRALLSPEHLKEVAEGFGGLNFRVIPPGKEWRAELAHAIAAKVLGPGWYYEVVESGKPDLPIVRIVITGRS